MMQVRYEAEERITVAQNFSPKAAQSHARRMKALQLRAERKTYQYIADRLYNGDRSNAYKDMMRAVAAQEQEAVSEVRAQEILLLDELARPLIERVKTAPELIDDKTVNSLLRIMERRAKYLGLDAPTQVEQTGTGGFAVLVNPDLLPDGADLGEAQAAEASPAIPAEADANR